MVHSQSQLSSCHMVFVVFSFFLLIFNSTLIFCSSRNWQGKRCNPYHGQCYLHTIHYLIIYLIPSAAKGLPWFAYILHMPLTVWFTLCPFFPIFAGNVSLCFILSWQTTDLCRESQRPEELPLLRQAAAPLEIRIRLQLCDEVREAALQLQRSRHFLGAGARAIYTSK